MPFTFIYTFLFLQSNNTLLEIHVCREYLLCYNQSQQSSGHANQSQNHKLINILACSLVSHTWLAFFLQDNNIPEIFLVFMVFDCSSLFEIMYIDFVILNL